MTETQVVNYNVTNAAIQEMSEMYLPLTITGLDDKEQFDAVHSARMVVRGKRIEVEKKRVELKADALKWGKLVQTEANRIFALIEPIESHLKNEEGKAEAERKRLDDERIAGIRAGIEHIQYLLPNLNGVGTVKQLNAVIAELKGINVTPDKFFEFTSDAAQAVTNALCGAEQALEQRERLDREEAERKAESERLAIERKKQEEEAAKLKEQQDKIDEQNRKLQAEKDALEAEKRAEQERKDREEFERKAVERAKEEAIKKSKQDAIDKAEREKAEAEEAERQKALLPDKEKLEAFAQFLEQGVTYPDVKNENANIILANAETVISDLAGEIYQKAQKL